MTGLQENFVAVTQEKELSPASLGSAQADEVLDKKDFQTTNVVLISLGHAAHDTYTAFIAPLLPVLIENLSLTKTLAGMLTIFTQIPSLFQPIIGHIADRANLRYFVILTPAITGILLSLIGVTPSYAFIAFLLLLAGFSSAALHSVGPVMVGHLSGSRLGQGMSFWMVGGEIGRVLGPIVIVTAIGYLTFDGIPWLMIGGILVSILLFIRLKDADGLTAKRSNGLSMWSAIKKMKPLLLPLTAIVLVRAFMMGVLTTYLPTFLTDEGANLGFAGISLSILEAAGVVGAMLAGSISDKVGRRIVLLVSLLSAPVFMFIFLQVNGWFQIPVLLALGFSSISITPVIMALVQESFPENRALANGVYMALSFMIRSLVVIVIGLIGDHFGLRLAFNLSALIMLVGVPFLYLLPGDLFKKQNV